MMKISHFSIYIGSIPLILSPVLGFKEAASKTKHSILHMIQGLLPLLITDFYKVNL